MVDIAPGRTTGVLSNQGCGAFTPCARCLAMRFVAMIPLPVCRIGIQFRCRGKCSCVRVHRFPASRPCSGALRQSLGRRRTSLHNISSAPSCCSRGWRDTDPRRYAGSWIQRQCSLSCMVASITLLPWPHLRVNHWERQPSSMFNLALRRVIVKYQACFPFCRVFVFVYAIQVSKLGATELAVSILGPWDKAPKAGRVAYEQYTAAIAALVGGEASTEVRVL